jgi:hypothetical protein
MMRERTSFAGGSGGRQLGALGPVLWGVLVVFLVQGCSGVGTRSAPAPVREAGRAEPAAPAEPRAPAKPRAPTEDGGATQVYAYRAPAAPVFRPSGPVLGLVEQSRRERQQGDLTAAAATLERALRIEPRNPHLWNRLAQVRLEQGLYGQADSLAAKSNALAGDAPALKQDNQRIIAAARKAGGG